MSGSQRSSQFLYANQASFQERIKYIAMGIYTYLRMVHEIREIYTIINVWMG